jgi:hypothetical protein
MKLKPKKLNLFRVLEPLLCMLFCFLPLSASASDLPHIDNNNLIALEKIFLESGPGLDFIMVGKSLLENQSIQKISTARLKITFPVKKAFLIWSGEVKEENKNAGKIRFLGPKNKEHPVTAQRVWRTNSTGTLYSAVADVTPYVKGSGLYGVKNLSSDVVNPGGKDPFSVAGWALIVLTEDRKSHKTTSVAFLAGLQVLKPGETHNIHLTPYLSKGHLELRSLGIIGGHGRAGNGSGNLINGKALSGQDDWDGSAGKFWDIDLFQLNLDTNSVARNKDLTLTVDPLLQWLYPIGVIIKAWSTE